MDFPIVVPYARGLTPTGVVAAWNDDPAASQLAVAIAADRQEPQYALELVGSFLVVLGSVAAGIASNALYDVLVDLLARRTSRTFRYKRTVLPDGTEVTEMEMLDR